MREMLEEIFRMEDERWDIQHAKPGNHIKVLKTDGTEAKGILKKTQEGSDLDNKPSKVSLSGRPGAKGTAARSTEVRYVQDALTHGSRFRAIEARKKAVIKYINTVEQDKRRIPSSKNRRTFTHFTDDGINQRARQAIADLPRAEQKRFLSAFRTAKGDTSKTKKVATDLRNRNLRNREFHLLRPAEQSIWKLKMDTARGNPAKWKEVYASLQAVLDGRIRAKGMIGMLNAGLNGGRL